MTFQDPIVAENELIRDAIHSSNYDPGNDGWSINRDGSAEFRDVTIAADASGVVIDPTDGITITDPDGSVVHIYDEPLGNGAVIDMKPADLPGHTMGYGNLSTDSAVNRGYLSLHGPPVDGSAAGYISLGNDVVKNNINMNSDEINLYGSGTHIQVGASSGYVDVGANYEIRFNGISKGYGIVGGKRYRGSGSLSSGIAGTEVLTGMDTGSVEGKLGRHYRVPCRVYYFPSSSSVSWWILRIRKTSTSGYLYAQHVFKTEQNSYGMTLDFSGFVTPSSDNTSTYVLTCQRLSGTATLSILNGGANNGTFMFFQDECPSGTLPAY